MLHLIVHCGPFAFGLPVSDVVDVVRPAPVTPVPGAPRHILGCLNLRGRIVTAVDLRRCLELLADGAAPEGRHVVCEAGDELFSLAVDSVGDVMPLSPLAPPPANLSGPLKSWTRSVYVDEGRLVAVLDMRGMLGLS